MRNNVRYFWTPIIACMVLGSICAMTPRAEGQLPPPPNAPGLPSYPTAAYPSNSATGSLNAPPAAADGPRLPEALPPAASVPTYIPPSAPLDGPTGPAPTIPTSSDVIADVRVEGNRSTTAQKVMSHVKTRTGRNFDQATVVEDIRRLTSTHKFVDVRPLYQRVPEGVVVTFQVIERPLVEYVRYVGNNSYKDSRFKEHVDITPGGSLDLYQVEEGRRKVENFYHEKGFNDVQVTIFEGNKPSDRGVTYFINEGRQQKVWWVNFVGNTIATDARLRTQIQSGPGVLWIFKGFVDTKKIDEDVEKLTAYYQSLGYFQVKIGREMNFDDDHHWMTLTFIIQEGPRFVVRNVNVIGNKKFPTEKLTADLKLKGNENKFFDAGYASKDSQSIRDVYGSQGYVFADVQVEKRFLEEPGKLDIVYSVAEGDRYRIGKINVHITGDSPHTKESTIINRISQRPGDIADIREIRNSERRLKASGLFNVNPQTGPTPKIVFTPPNLDEADKAQWANRAVTASPKYRGQSPDGPSNRPTSSPAGDGGEKVLEWHIFMPDEAKESAKTPSATTTPAATSTTPRSSAPAQMPWPPVGGNR